MSANNRFDVVDCNGTCIGRRLDIRQAMEAMDHSSLESLAYDEEDNPYSHLDLAEIAQQSPEGDLDPVQVVTRLVTGARIIARHRLPDEQSTPRRYVLLCEYLNQWVVWYAHADGTAFNGSYYRSIAAAAEQYEKRIEDCTRARDLIKTSNECHAKPIACKPSTTLSETPNLDAAELPRLDRFSKPTKTGMDSEFVAKAYDQNGNRLEACDYHSDSAKDCRDTSRFELGRSDRNNSLPCRHNDGRYLEGWYSVQPPRHD